VDAPASQLPGTYLGRAVAGLGDVDLDGVPDFAASAGAWSFCPARQVFVFSGATGAVVWQITGLCGLGVSLARIGDLDGDQADELIAGDVYALNAYGHYAGAVNVYSGATGVLLRHFETDDPHIGFGESVCAVQDIDHDGFDEIAVGCPGDSAYVTHGRIEVFSGGSGAQMLVIDEPYQSTAQLLGRYVDTVEDIDGDGSRDLLSGVVRGDVSHARLYSSRTGALVVEGFHMPGLYSSVASLGDLNGDGTAEIACRAWSYDAGTWHDTVEISLFGVAVPETYCTAKVNSLGCTPEIGSSGAASLAVGDNFVVGASNVLNAKPGVLLWGASPLSTPFAGGTLCVAPTPPSIRGPLLDSGGSPPSASDCTGSYSFHFSHALMQSRGLTAGTQLYAQFLSRDPGFAPPRNVGLTDARSFTVIP
jgi:hypothetical protein